MPVVRWEAKPAPPRVFMSRVPWNFARREEGEQVRFEIEEPPRTRSSDEVHSFGVQALEIVR